MFRIPIKYPYLATYSNSKRTNQAPISFSYTLSYPFSSRNILLNPLSPNILINTAKKVYDPLHVDPNYGKYPSRPGNRDSSPKRSVSPKIIVKKKEIETKFTSEGEELDAPRHEKHYIGRAISISERGLRKSKSPSKRQENLHLTRINRFR
jgi:hypothetical protein